jgi:hypothetical protein
MYDLSFVLVELFSIMACYLFIFVYSIISSDLIVVLIGFLLYLVLIIPFTIVLDALNQTITLIPLEEKLFINYILYLCELVNVIIGVILFIELTYLFFLN